MNKMIKIDDFPRMVILDILNICNLRCSHCPQKELTKAEGFKPTFLDLKLFEKIINEISCHDVDLIRFTGDGEPLLHKNILEMIAFAKSKTKAKINLTTNGLLLSDKISKFLLNLPIDFIDVSIDAHTENTYKQIRRGGDFNKLLSNVDRLIKLKSEANSPAKIMVNMIGQVLVKDEIEDFRGYWSKKVDYVLIRNLHTANNYLKESICAEDDLNRYPCPHLYKRITIDFSGNVKFCAHDWFDRSIVGNLRKDSIAGLWNGPKYKALRVFHERKEFRKIALCDKCQDWKSVPWDYGYDKIVKKLTN